MGITSKFSNTSALTLWELHNGNVRFYVPKFQRNYAWNKEKVETLWSDLMEGFQNIKDVSYPTQEGQYLLGPIVLVHEKENKYWVIDGQQRLSTITMLFCVARDIIRENIRIDSNMAPAGYGGIMEMLENTDMRGKHSSWKLVLNDTDVGMFRQIQEYEDIPKPQVERFKEIKPKTKSQKLLKENYVLLYDKIMNAVCTRFDDQFDDFDYKKTQNVEDLIKQNLETLNHFLTHVKINNFVVKVVVEDSGTAYQIFETLNYRGEELSKSNLIKNYVLNLVKNEDDQYSLSNDWNNIFDIIIDQGEKDDVFILESLRSRNFSPYKKPTKNNLYDIVRASINDDENARNYVKNLTTDAEFLATLYNPKKYKDNSSEDDIYAIKTLGAKSIRVPILVAYRKWFGTDKTSYRRLVEFLVKFFFKIKIIRGIHAGKIEKIMSEISEMIESGKPLQNVIKKLQEHDDHEDFKYNFGKFMADPPPNAAKYTLQQITMSLEGKYVDARHINSLTLEHILPQKIEEWDKDKFFQDYHGNKKMEDFIGHLGNLTLLKDTLNSKLQNARFEKKKCSIDDDGHEVGYETSLLKINLQTVCNHREWTARIIEERGKSFEHHADPIWTLD